jgi:PST family polysaccharide transporter
VSLSILASAQVASIQGFRRMGDFARLQLYSNLVAAVAGVSAVWILGEEAILFVVLATPVSGWLLGLYFARRLPHGPRRPFAFRNMTPIWRMLVRVGLAVAATAIISSVTQIAARTIVLRQFGLEGVGFFQAAWTISAVNMGLLLASMGADYYPRLSAAAHDDALITEHVNQQIHVGLVLAGPVLTGVTCLAPLVLQILYSSKFTEATHLLQWLTAADVLRLTGWSLGFVMLARQASLSFVAIEATFAMVFLPLMWWLAPALGLEAVGLAYFLGYFVCLLVSLFLAVTVQRVHVSLTNLLWTFLLTLLMLALIFGFRLQPLVATIFGLVAAAGLAIFALFEIHRMGVAFPVVGPLLRRAETILGSTRKAPPSP